MMRKFGLKVGKKMGDEQASVLLSAVLFITFISTLLIGTAYYSSKQMIQYSQVSKSYTAKSMIEVSEHILFQEHMEELSDSKMTVEFNQGIVTSHPEGEGNLKLLAILDDGYTSQRSVKLPEVEETEENKELDESEDSKQEDAEKEEIIENKETEEKEVKDSDETIQTTEEHSSSDQNSQINEDISE